MLPHSFIHLQLKLSFQEQRKKSQNKLKSEIESVLSATTSQMSGVQPTEPDQGQSGHSLLAAVGCWEF